MAGRYLSMKNLTEVYWIAAGEFVQSVVQEGAGSPPESPRSLQGILHAEVGPWQFRIGALKNPVPHS